MGFKLVTNRFIVNSSTHCATQLGDNYWKETFYKTTLDFIVNNMEDRGVQYHLNLLFMSIPL